MSTATDTPILPTSSQADLQSFTAQPIASRSTSLSLCLALQTTADILLSEQRPFLGLNTALPRRARNTRAHSFAHRPSHSNRGSSTPRRSARTQRPPPRQNPQLRHNLSQLDPPPRIVNGSLHSNPAAAHSWARLHICSGIPFTASKSAFAQSRQNSRR